MPQATRPPQTLAKPYGPNLSTHTMSLSTDGAIDSTCRATLGVSCYIQASGNGKTMTVSDTKAVTAEASDNGVDLPWNIHRLSAGTWLMQAVAAKDGLTTSSDSETLVITP